MKNDYEYEYDYHNLAENAEFIEENDNDDYYYDDGSNEPWVDAGSDDYAEAEYQDYYFNLTEETDDN